MALLLQRSDVGEFRRRYRWMVLLVAVAFVALSFRVGQLQLLEGDLHRTQAHRNIVRRVTLATTRGLIRDAHGKVLAANRPSYNVYVVPEKIDMQETWPRVVQLMGLSDSEAQELEAKVRRFRADDRKKTQQVLLKVDVDRDIVASLETQQPFGLEVAPAPVRYYPHGRIGAHSIGYLREVDGEDLVRLEGYGYRPGDRIGAIGVERRWESYLRGQRGWRKRVKSRPTRHSQAEIEARYLEPPQELQPVPGRDISLTIDIELASAVERALRGHAAGAVVVLDVRTGRILAALSKPGLDPDVLSGGEGKDAIRDSFKRLFSDPLKPILDKTISAAYPPGSTYKPFSALAALADGVLTPRDEVDCRGGYEFGRRYFRCTGVHRHVDLNEAIIQSCNTYFYALGEKVHIDRLAEIGIDFGFGAKTGLGVNPEATGRMPTKAWYARRYKNEGFRGGFTLLAAIGQGASTVTVLQAALAYGALANGGTLYQPQVVRSIETSEGTIVQDFPPRVRRLLQTDPSHVTLVKNAMRGVLSDPEGTGYDARIEGVDMAGKTGTAEVSQRAPRGTDPKDVSYFYRDHAWFTGYAPADAPEIAIAVLIEHGGGGGKHAVPVAMQVVKRWQELKAERLAPLAKTQEAF